MEHFPHAAINSYIREYREIFEASAKASQRYGPNACC